MATLKMMREKAREFRGDPTVRAVALNVIKRAGVQSHDYLGEARALARFVQAGIRYVKDATGVEQIHSPVLLLRQIAAQTCQADCDDQALLLATLLLSVGHAPKFRVVRYKAMAGGYNHIYVVEYFPQKGKEPKRFVMDPIIKDKPIGFEVSHKSGDEITV